MRAELSFYWLCIRDAASGSLNRSNAWSAVLGPLILGLLAYWLGYSVVLPDEVGLKLVVVAALFVTVAWPVVFAIRLLGAPARLYEALRAKLPQPIRTDLELRLNDGAAHEGRAATVSGSAHQETITFLVRVTNVGGKFLRHCQVSVVVGNNPYPVSRNFDLRQGETIDLPTIRVSYRATDPRAFVYFLSSENWKVLDGAPALLLGPGGYEIQVISADTSPAVLPIEVTATATLPRDWNVIPRAVSVRS
jgi:hypothetical protein